MLGADQGDSGLDGPDSVNRAEVFQAAKQISLESGYPTIVTHGRWHLRLWHHNGFGLHDWPVTWSLRTRLDLREHDHAPS